MITQFRGVFAAALLSAALGNGNVAAVLIDFETLADLDTVTNQFAPLGIAFSNAIALQAGLSLNESDFPPNSDVTAVANDGGPITLSFSQPALDVGAFFTYTAPLTLTAFDSLGGTLGSVTSAFGANFASSGTGAPNEFLQLAFAGGISSLTITGDPLGNSFVLDDLSFNLVRAVPEPASTWLLAAGLLAVSGFTRCRAARSTRPTQAEA